MLFRLWGMKKYFSNFKNDVLGGAAVGTGSVSQNASTSGLKARKHRPPKVGRESSTFPPHQQKSAHFHISSRIDLKIEYDVRGGNCQHFVKKNFSSEHFFHPSEPNLEPRSTISDKWLSKTGPKGEIPHKSRSCQTIQRQVMTAKLS